MNSNPLFKTLNKFEAPKGLTDRENEILSSLSRGSANKEIAAQMNITVPTVRTHLRHIYEKLAVRSRAEAIVKYYKEIRPAGTPPLRVVEPKTVPVHEKHATHRHDRRKVREFLRHTLDAEEDSFQIEEFGE